MKPVISLFSLIAALTLTACGFSSGPAVPNPPAGDTAESEVTGSGESGAVLQPIEGQEAAPVNDSLTNEWAGIYGLGAGVPFSVTFTESEIEGYIDAAVEGTRIDDVVVDITPGGLIAVRFNAVVGENEIRTEAAAVFSFAASDGALIITAEDGTMTVGSRSVSIPQDILDPISEALTEIAGESDRLEEQFPGTELTYTAVTSTDSAITFEGRVARE